MLLPEKIQNSIVLAENMRCTKCWTVQPNIELSVYGHTPQPCFHLINTVDPSTTDSFI